MRPDLRKSPKSCYKNKVQEYLLQILKQEDGYVGTQTITLHLRKLMMMIN